LLESEVFRMVVGGFILIALAGTVYSTYRIVQSTRRYRAGKRKPRPNAA
jgi:hypothetical protein